MPHQDRSHHRSSASTNQPSRPNGNHQDLRRALDWLLAGIVLSNVQFRGDSTWTPIGLIRAALLWAWSDEKTLTGRFQHARKIFMRAWGGREQPAGSYQAFTKILRKWTTALVWAVSTALRQHMQEDLAERFVVGGFAVFAADGSRLGLPRTDSNQQGFSPRKKKCCKRQTKTGGRTGDRRKREADARKADSPQMWLTVMWHVGTGLPWDWRTGPSDSSEREHFAEMLDALPAGALITADAGFVGYEYWRQVIDGGRHFVIRVGANVKLLKKLGYVRENNGVVYLWPERAAAKGRPPLVLRMVEVNEGRHPAYLVTSILDPQVLSHKQLAEIYSQRWGIELFYRHFKQTFERTRLRSHCANNAQVEAEWSLVAIWAMMLHAQYELAKQGVAPPRISVAGVLRAYRRPLREYKSRPDPGESLDDLLSLALIDDYQRKSKTSRNYPRKKQKHQIGAPEIVTAAEAQIQKAKRIKKDMKKGLTA